MSRGFGFAALGLLVLASAAAAAHGGGLNAEGCHNNRKTGDYHCHRKPAASAPAASLAPAQRALGNAAANRGAAVFYRNCSEARAAGATPVRRGDPGYGSHLDRDNDGSGCE
ncbi:MAG TPA: excalibur calcium-binding domain-containing protein [Erythrobacter sp.]|nr:excalibur calcium-binding domain-containing protein [Erythrobacter sp.]